MHPLHENRALVDYLRAGIAARRFEVMLHGYHHDEPERPFEFANAPDLARRVADGRKYLEDLLGATIRVFVPPRNTIGRVGLRAISLAGLNLGGTAGRPIRMVAIVESHMGLVAAAPSLAQARRPGDSVGARSRRPSGNRGHGHHPGGTSRRNEAIFEHTLARGGVFCAATHYWEHTASSVHAGAPTVGEQLRRLIARATSDPRVVWRSVGDVMSDTAFIA